MSKTHDLKIQHETQLLTKIFITWKSPVSSQKLIFQSKMQAYFSKITPYSYTTADEHAAVIMATDYFL